MSETTSAPKATGGGGGGGVCKKGAVGEAGGGKSEGVNSGPYLRGIPERKGEVGRWARPEIRLALSEGYAVGAEVGE